MYPAPMGGTFHFAGGFFHFEEFLLQSLHQVKHSGKGITKMGLALEYPLVWARPFALPYTYKPQVFGSCF
jgi:hypothetical protein